MLTLCDLLSRTILDAALKGTLLLFVACVAAWILRRASAALLHRLWSLTLLGLLLLPLLSLALPAWRLPLLPEASVPSEPVAPKALAASVPNQALPQNALPGFMADGPIGGRGDAKAAPQSNIDELVGAFNTGSQSPQQQPALWRLGVAAAVSAIWLSGTLLVLAGLCVGIYRTCQLSWRSQQMAGWQPYADEQRQRLGLLRAVELREHAQPFVPLTSGIFRPMVLLPKQAREWSESLQRAVLLHELAHVQRGDVIFQLLGRLACAFYWFHPLAWWALNRLRLERELACDDAVVRAGERASDYAAQLLEVARMCQQPSGVPLLAVAMAQGSNLEHRVRTMFDASRSHAPLRSGLAAGSLLGTLALVTLLAAAQLVARTNGVQAADEPPPSPPATNAVQSKSQQIDQLIQAKLRAEFGGVENADRGTRIRRWGLDLRGVLPTPAEIEEYLNDKDADADAKCLKRMLDDPVSRQRLARLWLDQTADSATDRNLIVSQVVDVDGGKPVAGAIVELRYYSGDWQQRMAAAEPDGTLRPLASRRLKSDAEGHYTLPLPLECQKQNCVLEQVVTHPDFVVERSFGYWHLDERLLNDPERLKANLGTKRIKRGHEVTGKILGPDGKPKAGVPVLVAEQYPEYLGRTPITVTDAAGRFKVRIPDRQHRLYFLPTDAVGVARVVSREYGEQKPLKLERGTRVRGRVVNAQGKGVAQVAVQGDGEDGVYGGKERPLLRVLTDADGRYELPPVSLKNPVDVRLRDHGDLGAWKQRGISLPGVFLPTVAQVKAGEPLPATLEINFAPVASVKLTAKVVNADGTPYPSANLEFYGSSPVEPHLRWRGYFRDVKDKPGVFELNIPKGLTDAAMDLSQDWLSRQGGFNLCSRAARPGEKGPRTEARYNVVNEDDDTLIVQVPPDEKDGDGQAANTPPAGEAAKAPSAEVAVGTKEPPKTQTEAEKLEAQKLYSNQIIQAQDALIAETKLAKSELAKIVAEVKQAEAKVQNFRVKSTTNIKQRTGFDNEGPELSRSITTTFATDEKGRIRSSEDGGRPGNIGTTDVFQQRELAVFDGKQTTVLRGQTKYDWAYIGPDKSRIPMEVDPRRYLMHFFSTVLSEELGSGRYKIVGLEKQKDIELVRVESEPVVRNGSGYRGQLLLDPAHGWIPVSRGASIRFEGQETWHEYTRTETSDFTRTGTDGTWLPGTGVYTSWNVSAEKAKLKQEPTISWQYHVTFHDWEISPKFADSDFELQIPEGIFVQDERGKEAK